MLDPRNWTQHLPEVVMAFFFVTPKEPSDNDREQAGVGEATAKAAHKAFKARYPQAQTPLVRLQLARKANPFEMVLP